MSHNEPIAWAVLLPDGDRIYDVYAIEEEAKAIDAVVTGNHDIVPLCRSPTLTDEEREAVRFCVAASLPETEKLGGVAGGLCRMHAATLRGLLERTK